MNLAGGGARAQGTVSLPEAGDQCRSGELLARLEQAHSALQAAMEELDGITRMPLADRTRYTGARWRISAASLARRTVLKDCIEHLRPIVDSTAAQALDEFNRENLQLIALSAAHVARWPADAIEREWNVYCPASREIRRRLAAAIEQDKRRLCPLLRLESLKSAHRS